MKKTRHISHIGCCADIKKTTRVENMLQAFAVPGQEAMLNLQAYGGWRQMGECKNQQEKSFWELGAPTGHIWVKHSFIYVHGDHTEKQPLNGQPHQKRVRPGKRTVWEGTNTTHGSWHPLLHRDYGAFKYSRSSDNMVNADVDGANDVK
jgi:hypothetical protein